MKFKWPWSSLLYRQESLWTKKASERRYSIYRGKCQGSDKQYYSRQPSCMPPLRNHLWLQNHISFEKRLCERRKWLHFRTAFSEKHKVTKLRLMLWLHLTLKTFWYKAWGELPLWPSLKSIYKQSMQQLLLDHGCYCCALNASTVPICHLHVHLKRLGSLQD